jgi:hypothetical protein
MDEQATGFKPRNLIRVNPGIGTSDEEIAWSLRVLGHFKEVIGLFGIYPGFVVCEDLI